MLRRYVRAQARSGEKLQSLDEATGVVLRAGEHHPTGAVATHAVGLGQAIKCDGEQVWGERSNGDMLRAVVKNAVIDLISQDEQVMLAGDVDNLLQNFA